jgi:hypothetical protein
MSLQLFQIEWKGRALGGFTLADLQARLAAGEISRLHRVQVEGTWRPLGEWFDQLEANQRVARSSEQVQLGRELDTERSRNAVLEDRLQHVERRVQQAPSASQQAYGISPATVPPPLHAGELPQMSGLAVAALVFGILSGVFFCCAVVLVSERMPRWLGLLCWGISVSWGLCIVYGHIALSEMRREETLRGRGLALAGITIAYAIIALITFSIIYATLDDHRTYLR